MQPFAFPLSLIDRLRPWHLPGPFFSRLHHTHCPELGVLLELTYTASP